MIYKQIIMMIEIEKESEGFTQILHPESTRLLGCYINVTTPS